MTVELGSLLKKGDAILLTAEAAEWTHGKIFYVDEVKLWGVTCWAEMHPGQAWYRAPWAQIAGQVPEEAV